MRLLTSILLTLAWAGAASAGTIVSNTFTGVNSAGAVSSLLAVSWTQTGTYINVDIGANLISNGSSSPATGTAYLMSRIGPGTTAADQVAAPLAVSVLGNPGINAMTTIFTGLTLGPGSYYLVIAPDAVSGTDALYWDGIVPPSATLDTGVTLGPAQILSGTQAAYAPASTFTTSTITPIFIVTGTTAPVSSAPEPASALLVALGAVAGAAMRLRRPAKDA